LCRPKLAHFISEKPTKSRLSQELKKAMKALFLEVFGKKAFMAFFLAFMGKRLENTRGGGVDKKFRFVN